jgi:glycosyltransferase involved in cell wall biosynthesis
MSENKQPVFSIITPTCRRPQLLKRTIYSVIKQTFSDFEHIIIDDANDRDTESLVNEIGDKRISFYQNNNSKGAAGSYNSGIKISKGRFILFLDDDDEYLPSFLEKMYNHFCHCGKNIGFIWSGISRIKDTVSGEEVILSRIWPSKFLTKEQGLVEATSIGNGFGVCIRKECIDIIGIYDESLIMGQDTDFLFRLAAKFEFETVPEVLVLIHQHGSSQLTNEKNNSARLEFKEKILNKHSHLLEEFPQLYYVHYKAVVSLCYNLKLKQKGRKRMLSIIKNNPFRISNFTDLLSYELFGKDTLSLLYESRLGKFVHFLKGKYLKLSSKKAV